MSWGCVLLWAQPNRDVVCMFNKINKGLSMWACVSVAFFTCLPVWEKEGRESIAKQSEMGKQRKKVKNKNWEKRIIN